MINLAVMNTPYPAAMDLDASKGKVCNGVDVRDRLALMLIGHTCGLLPASKFPFCFGYNGAGESATPNGAQLAMKAVVVGMRYSCGITSLEDIICWGDLPRGTTYPANRKWSMISSGDSHLCGITTDGMSHCWGNWILGEAALANPSQNATFAGWSHISCGSANSCAVQNNTGYAICWGITTNGVNDIPTLAAEDGNGWLKISVGSQHACGISLSGKMHCWGAKDTPGYNPQIAGMPMEVESWSMIASGYMHSCGLSSGGQQYCWGDGGNFRTEEANPGWKIMNKGGIFYCHVNSTSHGTCSQLNAGGGTGTNQLCSIMCQQDLPRLLVAINSDIIKTNSMVEKCQQQCCVPVPMHLYSAF